MPEQRLGLDPPGGRRRTRSVEAEHLHEMDWNDKTGPVTPGAEIYHEDSLPHGSRKGLVNVGAGSGVGPVAPPVALDLLRGPQPPLQRAVGRGTHRGLPGL